MSLVVLGTSPNDISNSKVDYSSMGATQPTTAKVDAVFQAQGGSGSYDAKKQDAPGAKESIEKGDGAWNRKDYYAAYLFYVEAKGLCEGLPKSDANTRDLVHAYYSSARAAKLVRQDKRQTISCCSPIACVLPIIGCFLCVSAIKSSHWVTNEAFRSHIDGGLSLLDQYIQAIEKKHNISMGTNKAVVPDQVRRDLGWAYHQKARFYGIGEHMAPPGCGDGTKIQENEKAASAQCYSDCCFEGSDGETNASRYDLAARLTNLKLATEWDSSNQDYSAAYQRLDAFMKAPRVVYY